jgi:hypothetical protein
MKANPPHSVDESMVRDLARICLVPEQDFDRFKLTGSSFTP